MLILSRRPGETIRIDNDIELVFLGNAGSQMRVGIWKNPCFLRFSRH